MYYLAGIISLILAMVLQLSVGEFLQVASIKPTFLIIPLLFFSLGMYPRFLSRFLLQAPPVRMVRVKFAPGWMGWYVPRELPVENVFRGALLGLAAGFIEGINSRYIPGCIFSWVVTGFVIGLLAGPINKESRIVRSLLLFTAAAVQGALLFVSLLATPSVYPLQLLVQNVLFPALYTTLVGMPLIAVFERRKSKSINEGGYP